MRIDSATLLISASDLANHLVCRHLTALDLRAARGEIKREYREDPRVDALIERGRQHELAYLTHLESKGLNVVKDASSIQQTIDAMRQGVDVIAQAYLSGGQWHGRADVLRKVSIPSELGNWSYKVVDTKLARETRGGTILQLCLYSELVEKIQGLMPEWMHVVTPEFFRSRPEASGTKYRTHDYLAYYRFVKRRLENELAASNIPESYSDTVEHCDICSWWPVCNEQRRKDDHLSFVAGISKLQTRELQKLNVNTLANLAELSLPIRTERGSSETFEKLHEQARLQRQRRNTGQPVHNLLPLQPEHGLAKLPEPSPGDIFFDFESDPFVDIDGLQYLLGYVVLDQTGTPHYSSIWSLNRIAERQAFESFIDMAMKRYKDFPNMHIYHFTHYEPTALKRLAGRYASKEDELDEMLRAGLFVDLHAILKQTLRASVERYSLKEMEIFFNFERKIELRDARKNITLLECALELNDVDSVSPEIRNTVEAYNCDDCLSTLALRNWLEELRSAEIQKGKEISRPLSQPGAASEVVGERRARVLALMERLLDGLPVDFSQLTPEERAKWLIAHMLEWHRREEKATWWEYFRLCGLTDDELLEELNAIARLEFVERTGGTDRCPIHRYRFPFQDTDVREEDDLETAKGSFGTVVAIDRATRTIDVRKRSAMAEIHPTSAFVHDIISSKEIADSLYRLGDWIADHGIDAAGPSRAARDLLLRSPPRGRVLDPPLHAFSIVLELDHTVLPIQGPPGAGKTSTGARMICELIRKEKKIGITAMSHKVIRKLLDVVVKVAAEENLRVQCIQKVPDRSEQECPGIIETESNGDVIEALQNGEVQVAAGTAWLWSREEFVESVDVLFVDEAGQMSLADVLAVSQGAKSVVLLGDPRQLDQPLQGTHPPGVAVSALQHILGDEETMPEDRGLFLSQTWRLAPSICEFTSELFYEGRLQSYDPLKKQQLSGPSRFAGSGLFFVPVEHEGNQSSSEEEAEVVANIVKELTESGTDWIDQHGVSRKVELTDILIVAPYNAQVFKLSERLPNAKIGTVDKFQGQEAPVVIYSMTTSSPEEAPHGMEFLYSLNRFNVATSRAKCVCILVANPRLFEPECKTPRQMKLANALCRYLEMAKIIDFSR